MGIFEKNLQDLVKGIRNNKKREKEYIQQCIQEIKEELKSPKMDKKFIAISKLTYLHLLGYDMGWAAFYCVELASQSNFRMKRVGYLAASISFTENTDVMVLMVNLIKKDLMGADAYHTGLALNCLSNLCTPELARDLVSDVVTLLNSSRAYVRKKAVLTLYKIFVKYPEALRPAFPRLRDKLEDSDTSVVAATVNIICELARKNPKNYLPMAPAFFRLLTSLQNNWTLIKLVKLFASLTPLEPRLVKKLSQPIMNLIQTTNAKSLQYECMSTATTGMSTNVSLVRVSVDKLKTFVQDPDQNLKYLGLLGLRNVMKEYPRLVSDQRGVIQDCLEDSDVTIRYRALELLCGLVAKKNVMDIIGKLIAHARNALETPYRNYVIEKVIETCAQENYHFILDFEWYYQVIVELSELKNNAHGKLLANQLFDIFVRVPAIRENCVPRLRYLVESKFLRDGEVHEDMNDVLHASAFLVGEYATNFGDLYDASMVGQLVGHAVLQLPAPVQVSYIQCALKMYTAAAYQHHGRNFFTPSKPVAEILEGGENAAAAAGPKGTPEGEKLHVLRTLLLTELDKFTRSANIEVQERALNAIRLITLHQEHLLQGEDIAVELHLLFGEALKPISSKAQKKIVVPDGLDLDAEIVDPADYSDSDSESSEEEYGDDSIFHDAQAPSEFATASKVDVEASEKELQRMRERRENDPFYLRPGKDLKRPEVVAVSDVPHVDDIPVVELTAQDLNLPPGVKIDRKGRKYRLDAKGRRRRVSDDEIFEWQMRDKKPVKLIDEDVPDGAMNVESDESAASDDDSGLRAALDVDITTPLGQDEVLYSIQAYKRLTAEEERDRLDRERAQRSQEKEKKRRHRDKDGKHKHRHHHHKDGDKDEKKEKKEKKHRSHRHRDEGKDGKDERKERKKSKDRDGERKHRKSRRSLQPPAAPAGDWVVIAQDDNVDVYARQDCQAQGEILRMDCVLNNKSPEEALQNVLLHLGDTLTVKLTHDCGGKVVLSKDDVAPCTTAESAIPIKCMSYSRAQQLTGSVTYSVGGKSREISAKLKVPSSSFLSGEKISKDEFRKESGAISNKSTVKVNSKGKDVRELIQMVLNRTHAQTVDVSAEKVCMCARASTGVRVLFVGRFVSVEELRIDIKCSDGDLGATLKKELGTLLGS